MHGRKPKTAINAWVDQNPLLKNAVGRVSATSGISMANILVADKLKVE